MTMKKTSSGFSILMKKRVHRSPAKFVELMNAVTEEAYPLISYLEGVEDLDLDVPELDGLGEPAKKFLDDLQVVRAWAQNLDGCGDGEVAGADGEDEVAGADGEVAGADGDAADEEGEAGAAPTPAEGETPEAADEAAEAAVCSTDQYVDVTNDLMTKDTIDETFTEAITLHSEGGLLEIKSMATGDQKEARALVSKFMDQLIDDLLVYDDNEATNDVDLNDMEIGVLMHAMKTTCAKQGDDLCEDQQANWTFFDQMLDELAADANIDSATIDDMEVSDIWARMNLKDEIGDKGFGDEIKSKMRALMDAVRPAGPNNEDDVGDAAETAAGCCGSC